jgi:hypothetical protein
VSYGAKDNPEPPQDDSKNMAELHCVEECTGLEEEYGPAVPPPRMFKQPWMNRKGVVPRGGGEWRLRAGVARVVGGDLAPHGDEVASARSASIDESHASGSEGGDVGDHKGRRGGSSVADARGSGGGTHVQQRGRDCLPGCT